MQSRTVFERHPALTLSLVVLVTVGAADLAITGVLRARAVERDDSYRTRSPIYHHDLAPLRSVTTRWGPNVYHVFTNSLGFRDREAAAVPLVSERKRVLFLGDSFTEGIGVEYEASFVGRVGAALAPQGVEVLNAGVASYSPIIYLRKTRHLIETVGLRFDEVVVFLDVSDVPDEVVYRFDAEGRVVGLHDAEPAHPPARREARWFEHSTLLTAAVEGWSRFRPAAARDEPATGEDKVLWTVDPEVFRSRRAALGIERAVEHMAELHARLAERSIPLTIAVYPWPAQIERGDLDSIQVRTWKSFCEKRGIRFLNLFPHFIGREAASTVLARDFIPGDVHWSEAGHRRVAEAFLQDRATPRTP